VVERRGAPCGGGAPRAGPSRDPTPLVERIAAVGVDRGVAEGVDHGAKSPQPAPGLWVMLWVGLHATAKRHRMPRGAAECPSA